MKRLVWIVMLSLGLAARGAGAADAPVGQWKTVDEKSGAVESVVEIYDQGGKLFGKIANLTKPTDDQGKLKLCTKCTGADKDKPIVGLIIIKELGADGAHWKGGTILDPDDARCTTRSSGWKRGSSRFAATSGSSTEPRRG
jgi:uncharacterized protein (DUF2147 family)